MFSIPQPPDYKLDWDRLNAEFAWLRALANCPQDAIYHAEGDVWIHTRMVCEALLANDIWRALPEDERGIVFIAALMHDVGKPACTRAEDGRITSRGHSTRGAILAREILWRMNVPIRTREQIVGLIRWHQIPFFLIDSANAPRRLFEISQTTRCDLLALVTEADARGRVCQDQTRLLDNIALSTQFAAEQHCLDAPRQFPSDHSRFLYFQKEDRDPDYLAFDDTICEVIVMSGFPGVGKDTWIAQHHPDLPVVSLDALRAELKIKPTDNQGAVVVAAREKAREYLRRKQSFVWNATNISRQMREHCLRLCAAYNARLRIVYLETSETNLFAQNRARAASVPAQVITKLFARWEVPDLTEAHQVDWIVQ
ncbi:MAG TPA: AAA family ATPase [Blastocatellia bacterium]|nr:AAA family ATPase [Blastocatellia bacterium]